MRQLVNFSDYFIHNFLQIAVLASSCAQIHSQLLFFDIAATSNNMISQEQNPTILQLAECKKLVQQALSLQPSPEVENILHLVNQKLSDASLSFIQKSHKWQDVSTSSSQGNNSSSMPNQNQSQQQDKSGNNSELEKYRAKYDQLKELYNHKVKQMKHQNSQLKQQVKDISQILESCEQTYLWKNQNLLEEIDRLKQEISTIANDNSLNLHRVGLDLEGMRDQTAEQVSGCPGEQKDSNPEQPQNQIVQSQLPNQQDGGSVNSTLRVESTNPRSYAFSASNSVVSTFCSKKSSVPSYEIITRTAQDSTTQQHIVSTDSSGYSEVYRQAQQTHFKTQ